MFFGRKKKVSVLSYDKTSKKPAIRQSICTGERVAGFKDIMTGRFEEVALLKTDADLEEFRERYGITDEIETFY